MDELYTREEMQKLLNLPYNMNDYQWDIMQATDSLDTSMATVAVAGGGKTTLLEMQTKVFDHHKMRTAFFAFNASIAAEMKKRLQAKGIRIAYKAGDKGVYVVTSHAAGFRALKAAFGDNIDLNNQRKWHAIDTTRVNGRTFDQIMHRNDSRRAIRYNLGALVDIVRLTNTSIDPDSILALMNTRRSSFEDLFREDDPGYARRWAEFATSIISASVPQFLEEAHRGSASIDYTDMLFLPTVLADTIRERVPPRRREFDAILCDESQDFNWAQYHVINLHKPDDGDYIRSIVYDPMQSINKWAGASPEIAEHMIQEDEAERFLMPLSFRCPKTVKERVIHHVPHFDVLPDAPDGVVESMSMSQALNLVKDYSLVISRSTRHLVQFALELISRGQKVRLRGQNLATIFLGHLDDMEEYAAKNGLSFVGGQFRELCERYTAHRLAVMNKKRVGEDTIMEFESEMSTLYKLWSTKDNNTMTAFRQQLRDLGEAAADGKNKSGVRLMTIHTAKGLEARWIFILCSEKEYDALMNESRFPYGMAVELEDIKQEYNAWYVALTRTKEKVFVINAEEGINMSAEHDPKIAKVRAQPFDDTLSVDWNDSPERIQRGIKMHYGYVWQFVDQETADAYWASQEPRFRITYPDHELDKPDMGTPSDNGAKEPQIKQLSLLEDMDE